MEGKEPGMRWVRGRRRVNGELDGKRFSVVRFGVVGSGANVTVAWKVGSEEGNGLGEAEVMGRGKFSEEGLWSGKVSSGRRMPRLPLSSWFGEWLGDGDGFGWPWWGSDGDGDGEDDDDLGKKCDEDSGVVPRLVVLKGDKGYRDWRAGKGRRRVEEVLTERTLAEARGQIVVNGEDGAVGDDAEEGFFYFAVFVPPRHPSCPTTPSIPISLTYTYHLQTPSIPSPPATPPSPTQPNATTLSNDLSSSLSFIEAFRAKPPDATCEIPVLPTRPDASPCMFVLSRHGPHHGGVARVKVLVVGEEGRERGGEGWSEWNDEDGALGGGVGVWVRVVPKRGGAAGTSTGGDVVTATGTLVGPVETVVPSDDVLRPRPTQTNPVPILPAPPPNDDDDDKESQPPWYILIPLYILLVLIVLSVLTTVVIGILGCLLATVSYIYALWNGTRSDEEEEEEGLLQGGAGVLYGAVDVDEPLPVYVEPPPGFDEDGCGGDRVQGGVEGGVDDGVETANVEAMEGVEESALASAEDEVVPVVVQEDVVSEERALPPPPYDA
ncbi:hypothetical protein HDU97_006427 [Phlyctochytrium planicorne]|nr:hypothetical protein HDU97_006427 [Phlyctochytrium planicorne]